MPARLLMLLFATTATRAGTPGDCRELVRRSLAGLEQADRKLAEYSFLRAVERKEFSSNGALRAQHSSLTRRELQEGFMVSRLIERDGRAIPEEERRASEQALARRVAEWKSMTPEQRQSETEANRRRTDAERAWLSELPDAMNYTVVGEEIIHGRPAWVLACEPNPAYRPKNLRARVFEKVRGRVWIDQHEPELVRAEVETFDTVNVGWGVLGRIDKGTRFFVQRTRAAEGAWLPETQTLKFSARVMLFKTLASEVTTRYSDFRHRSEMEVPRSGL